MIPPSPRNKNINILIIDEPNKLARRPYVTQDTLDLTDLVPSGVRNSAVGG